MSAKTIKWSIIGIAILAVVIGMAGIALAQTPEPPQPDPDTASEKIEAGLAEVLAAGPADYIVRFSRQADLSAAYQMEWKARGEYVFNSLRDTAEASQSQAVSTLGSLGLRYQTFIAGNELYVWGGSLDAAQSLAALPEVEYIRETRVYHIDPVVAESASPTSNNWASDLLRNHDVPLSSQLDPTSIDAPTALAWGITDSGADLFWSTFGFQGDGIVVANIDTGVDYTHSALEPNYKCNGGPHDNCWLDPDFPDCSGPGDGPCDTPYFGIYHGTHTMGTMVAENDPGLTWQAGMAPNAQWIACLGCPFGGCPDYDLNVCADWILAPGGDPNNRPNVVNNSWGGWGGDAWYLDKVNAWRAAGIFPAFSAGNAGPGCSSLGSPGDYQESFGSAAHDSSRMIADFSSRGPSFFGDDPYTKPNLSAPGVDIPSTQPGDSWASISGTSMASPHTAGAVALLWSCNPGLVGQIDQTFQILQGSTDTAPDGNCGAPADGEGNFTYGYGYLNVYNTGLQWCGEVGILQWTITDHSSSDPIPLAHVFSTPGLFEANTDDTGFYNMTMMVGSYDITAEAFGYYPQTAAIEIITDTVTTQDFVLEPAPTSLVSGYVTDLATGWPLYASIEIAGYPYGAVWNDPVTGYYQVSLPQGSAYEFTVNAWVPGYLPATRTVGPFSSDISEDFALEADLTTCTAPGYQFDLVYQQDFEADNGSFSTYGYGYGGNSWQWGQPYPYPGPGQAHSGVNVWATNLSGNYYDGEDSYIESPDIDLSSYAGSGVKLSWWDWLQTESCCDFTSVQVSNDGGASWVDVYGPIYGGIQQWTRQEVILDASYAVSNFRLRSRLYTDGSVTYPGWYVDDITVETACQPQEGGLVVGNVYDTNLGMPITGAQVSNDSGESTYTSFTEDPAVEDAFYTLFSPAGLHDFTASYPNFNTVTEPVDVPLGGTIQHDFFLPAGHLVADPDYLSATLLLGTSESQTLDLINDGDGIASFEIIEKNLGHIPAQYISTLGNAAPGDSSSTRIAPKGYTSVQALPEPEGGVINADTVAIFKDADPWGTMDVENFLAANGITYEVHTSAEFGSLDFNDYKMIVFSGDQPQSFYDAYAGYVWKFEEYVENGGFLNFFASDSGWNGGSLTAPLPGGMTWTGWVFEDYNVIDDTSHPVVQGVPNPFWGSSASHGHFSNLPADGHIIAHEQIGGQPTIVEYNLGAGWLIAFGQPLEISHNWGWDAGIIMENTLIWGWAFQPLDVPWLSTSPVTGTIPAGNSQLIDVTLDATLVAQPGDYLAELIVTNDTPYGPVEVPVNMVVIPPETWGKLEGTVTGLGYCDANPGPLEGAQVLIEASSGMSWTVETDESGHYQWWLDEAHSPLSVTVTFPEHETGQASGVVVVGLESTIQDFDLRWLVPCMSVDPLSLSAELDMGATDTQYLELFNDGAGEAAFELNDREQGFTPAISAELVPTRVPGNQVSSGNGAQYASTELVARQTFTYQPPESAVINQGTTSVLLVSAYEAYQLQALLLAYPDLFPVDVFDARYSTPDLGLLQSYAAVVVMSNNAFADPIGLGNVLADYVDAGGSVVQTVPTFYDPYSGGWGLRGRFVDEGYSPFVGTGDWFLWADLGDFDSSHPIMQGVTYAGDYFRQMVDLNTDAEWVASWSDDEFIATKSKVVALNTFLVDGYSWSGDIPLIVHNSIIWLQMGGDAPWLSQDPSEGTIPADSSLGVDVTFDASAVLQPGDYYAVLNVRSNDPLYSTIGVQITMTVAPPADWGKLTGVVSSLGYCDQNPTPLEGASVVVDVAGAPYTFTTGIDGSYSIWAPEGTVSVQVSADTHEDASATADIVAGEITSLDFDLRWMVPCISGAPTSLDVEVPWYFSLDVPFEVVNTGAGAGEFSLRESLPETISDDNSIGYTPPAASQEKAKNLAEIAPPEVTNETQSVLAPHGDILLDQPPSQENGIFSDVGCDICGGPQVLAENFAIAESTKVGQIIFWTGYFPGDVPIDPDNMTVIFHTDQFGLPGSAFYTESNVEYEREQTGVVLFGVHEWMHTLTLSSPVELEPGIYWVEIYNDTGFGTDDFFWETGYLDPLNGLPGSAFAFSAPGSGWYYDSYTNLSLQLIEGEADIPWLSENPSEGNVPADSTFPVELTFTALPSLTLDTTYTGTLIIKSDDPVLDEFTVPVSMTVIQPQIEVSFTPTTTAMSSPPGSMVQYQLTVQNNGNVPDTYELSLQGDDWPVLMLTHQVSLDPGESTELPIFVFIPNSAEDGEIDEMSVVAASSSDAVMGWEVSATADLSTRAFYNRIVRLTPAAASEIGDVGQVMAYHLTLWNLSLVSDTIELHGEAVWGTYMSETSFTLDSFESANVTVYVHIPFGAVPGDLDVASIMAVSQSDAGAWDETKLTTYAEKMYLFLPIMAKED